ncbi:hypothetical protein K502DRAFT_353598 [Neoconidiobolus thromboides FSU 785]|nr:hypothetical protein K502DRAFT_353598 [Neoconidiobolus thromboides FSU 785]
MNPKKIPPYGDILLKGYIGLLTKFKRSKEVQFFWNYECKSHSTCYTPYWNSIRSGVTGYLKKEVDILDYFTSIINLEDKYAPDIIEFDPLADGKKYALDEIKKAITLTDEHKTKRIKSKSGAAFFNENYLFITRDQNMNYLQLCQLLIVVKKLKL